MAKYQKIQVPKLSSVDTDLFHACLLKIVCVKILSEKLNYYKVS